MLPHDADGAALPLQRRPWSPTPKGETSAAAHRRFGKRLVEVERLGFDPNRLVDVVGIDDLVRVADRLRLPVLHYRERLRDVYVVPDTNISYRLRIERMPTVGTDPGIDSGIPAARLRERAAG